VVHPVKPRAATAAANKSGAPRKRGDEPIRKEAMAISPQIDTLTSSIGSVHRTPMMHINRARELSLAPPMHLGFVKYWSSGKIAA
jgi:hypothetical protein